MLMELNDLRIFLLVAEENSATRAAERLHMTQPGVSQHLSHLEGELGHKLFDRSGRNLALNEYGREFLGKARLLLAQADELVASSRGESCPIGTLSLGITESAALALAPKVLIQFRKRYPGVHLQMDVNDSTEIEHEILRGHCDLGVVTQGNTSHPQLTFTPLYEERIDLLMSATHPLAKKRRVSLPELIRFPLLLYPRKSRSRQLIDAVFHREGLFPKDTIDVYFSTAAVRLAESGLGIALLAQSFIEREMPRHRCVHLRIGGDPIRRTICAVRRTSATTSEATACFFEMLTQHRNSL